MIYLSVAESDAFSETFAKLKATLSSSSSEEVPPPAPSVGCMVMELRTHPAVHRAVESEIKREGVAVVGQLRREHKLRRALAEERLAYIRMRREHVHLHAEEIQLTVDEDVRAMDHHVATVQAMATRRLQVLLFECLGEIQKAIARAQQRVETQESSVDSMVATCELNYAWAIFAKRCEEHFSVASLVDIPPKMLTPSATYVENPSFVAWTTALAPYLSAQLDLPLASATLASPELTITRILAVNQRIGTATTTSPSKFPVSSNSKTRLVVPRHIGGVDDTCMASQFQSLHRLVGEWSALHRPSAFKRPKSKVKVPPPTPQPLFPDGFTCTTPLSSSTIRWLPLVPHGPLQAPTNGCIYYCLDDFQHTCPPHTTVLSSEPQPLSSLVRIASPNLQQHAAVAQTTALAARYPANSPAKEPLRDFAGPFRITHVTSHDHVVRAVRCTSPPSSALNRGDDESVGPSPERTSMHFAPANVSHLIQTATYIDMRGTLAPDLQTNLRLRYPPETFGSHVLSHLYMAVPHDARASSTTSSSNPLLESILHPISSDAVRALIATYVIRDPSVMMAQGSLYALYRPSFGFQRTAYCIVDTPGLLLQSHTPSASADAPSALVVQYTTTGTNAGQCAISTGVTKGDLPSLATSSSILGSFCSWRSCLDEAAAQGTTSHLCAAHHRLEPFLTPEERVQVLGGHSTHRRRCDDVMAPAMEIRQIKHSSSLLEELLNQQLRTTLVSFLEKMVTEGSNRALLAHFSAWNPDTCSSLNASQDDDAMPLEIIAEKDMLEAIWQVERAATDEVKTLVALGVYPTAELGLLRQKQDPTHTALQASKRKLKLFRARRQEEDDRLIKVKDKRPPLLSTSKSCPIVSKARKRRDGFKM